MMKKFLRPFILYAVGLCTAFISCRKDDLQILPTVNLSSLNFTSEPGEGEIKIKWNTPAENPGFMYIKMSYTDPRDHKYRVITLSPYTSELTIPNTRARYGNTYSFTFIPYSETDTPGTPFVLDKCVSGPAPSTVTITKTPIKLAKIITNAQEPSEGPLTNLTDGNLDNYFHSQWSNSGGTEPYHWIDLDLGQEVTRFEIHTWNRKGAGNNFPNHIKLYRLSKLDDRTVDMEKGAFYEYDHPNKTSGGEGEITYPEIDQPEIKEPIRYLRYCPNGTGGSKFWHLAELSISKVEVSVFNPETDEKSDMTDMKK